MKGIILAGGSGTRLYPITEGISKQLAHVFDKPMIFYPLSVLIEAGIRDILIITTPEDQEGFKRLLGDGSKFGVNLDYAVQPSPDGLAQAFIIGEEFIGNDACAMVLGDNIFYGSGFDKRLKEAYENAKDGKATIFGHKVPDPERFGIMEFEITDEGTKVLSVEEKPKNPKSKFAITGLYFYPQGVSKMAKEVKPSARGELEITTLNDMYLQQGDLNACLLDGGYIWYDTGTFESLNEASNTIRSIQKSNDVVICCPEAIAYRKGWISNEKIYERAEALKKNSYGEFLGKVIKDRMKFFITGVGGQLGHDIEEELRKRGFNNIMAPQLEELDITDKDKVMDMIKKYKPDVIFHCAAWTAVDKAEEMEEACYNVNVVGTKNITDAAIETDAKLLYMSTDYVFDGTKEGTYKPDDKVHPLSVYGDTKYKGEEEVRRNPKHYITRISWVFGINGNNFIKTMLKLSDNHDTLTVVNDQVGSPTYTVDLAKLLVDMSLTDKYGTYHVTNEGYCSWAEFADYIFKSNNKDTKVIPVTTEEYYKDKDTSKIATRPMNSKMDKSKLDEFGFDRLPSWQDATDRYCDELVKTRVLVRK